MTAAVSSLFCRLIESFKGLVSITGTDHSASFCDGLHSYDCVFVCVLSSNDREVSTTLLIIPDFCIANAEAFTSFTDTLTQPLEPLGIEKLIQVCWHANLRIDWLAVRDVPCIFYLLRTCVRACAVTRQLRTLFRRKLMKCECECVHVGGLYDVTRCGSVCTKRTRRQRGWRATFALKVPFFVISPSVYSSCISIPSGSSEMVRTGWERGEQPTLPEDRRSQ